MRPRVARLLAVALALPAAVVAEMPAAPPLFTLTGRGVQVYACAAATGSAAPAWVLDHPEADLFNESGKVVGHHDAGPRWQASDGSAVTAAAVEKKPAPSPADVPWLVLRVTTHEGSGVMTPVVTIRRTATHGGIAPRQGCDASMIGATVRVPYTASYSFYAQASK